MKIIMCLDNNNGILFNHRRQSKDCEVHRDMVAYAGNANLWMSEYSYKSFTVFYENCHVDDHFWELAHEGDLCFIEDGLAPSNIQRISEIIVYRWNRVYPSDVKFPQELLSEWKLVDCVNFSGRSHERITREVYRK